MRNTFLALSILFCSLIVANPVDTGHAKASLITNLQTTLNAALHAEAHDDKVVAIAKTAAIKNIQKAPWLGLWCRGHQPGRTQN